jgi:hypothetical protein
VASASAQRAAFLSPFFGEVKEQQDNVSQCAMENIRCGTRLISIDRLDLQWFARGISTPETKPWLINEKVRLQRESAAMVLPPCNRQGLRPRVEI